MEEIIHIKEKLKSSRIGKIPWYLILVVLVFLLAVLQDYIYSQVKHTGFYLSESILYNFFWVFFIPLSIFTKRVLKIFKQASKWSKIFLNLGIGISFSLLHLIIFSAFFVFISHLLYSPSHYFTSIFKTAFSNQFYITLLWYTFFPVFLKSTSQAKGTKPSHPEKISLKLGLKMKSISTSEIQLIASDKPYAAIYTQEQKFLDNKSLKEFEKMLDPALFLRVHRSAIINPKYLKELKSRSNGDYDVLLENGESVRLSRHFRSNWQKLLQ